jgi:hypothetical protein
MMVLLAPPVMSSETAEAALATKPGKLIVTFRWTGLSAAGLNKPFLFYRKIIFKAYLTSFSIS